MTDQRTSVIQKITPYLGLAEKLFLTGLVIGMAIIYFNTENKTIVQVAILGLAITYFLTAFRVIEIPVQEGEKTEFKDFLAWAIVPKAIWMFCGVSLFGLFAFSLQLGNDGYKQAFRIGALGIPIALLVIAYAFFTGTKYLNHLMPTVLRAVPLLAMDIYLLNS